MTKSAQQIMNERARRNTLERSAWDCHCAIYFTTDNANWLESVVIGENTLRAQAIMREAMK